MTISRSAATRHSSRPTGKHWSGPGTSRPLTIQMAMEFTTMQKERDGWNPGPPECLTRRFIGRARPAGEQRHGGAGPGDGAHGDCPAGTASGGKNRRGHREGVFAARGWLHAFSRNANGSVDSSPTIFPAVASWDGTYKLQHAQPMFDRWAAPEFSTDWGTRDLSPTVSFFDPISYHQGTVWPLYTGWTAVSEYRNAVVFRICASDAERRSYLGAGSRRGDRVALGPVLRALGAQHFSSTLVVGHGHLAGIARAFRFGVGCVGEQVDGDAQLAC